METLLQTWLFCLLGYLEIRLACLSDVFFPYERTNWIVIAEKGFKLPTCLAFKCVCKVTSDQGRMFLDVAVTQLRLCKYKLEWDALSPFYLQWSVPLQSQLILGISFVLSLNFYPSPAQEMLTHGTYPHGYVEKCVGMAKIPILVENSSAFDQCAYLSVPSDFSPQPPGI